MVGPVYNGEQLYAYPERHGVAATHSTISLDRCDVSQRLLLLGRSPSFFIGFAYIRIRGKWLIQSIIVRPDYKSRISSKQGSFCYLNIIDHKVIVGVVGLMKFKRLLVVVHQQWRIQLRESEGFKLHKYSSKIRYFHVY